MTFFKKTNNILNVCEDDHNSHKYIIVHYEYMTEKACHLCGQERGTLKLWRECHYQDADPRIFDSYENAARFIRDLRFHSAEVLLAADFEPDTDHAMSIQELMKRVKYAHLAATLTTFSQLGASDVCPSC